jgi:hypothetical protein
MQGSIPAYIVKGLLAHHGPALQKLTIRATSTAHTFTEEIFQLIGEHCGVLQELQVPLQRTTSGTDEAAALDALGSIRSLHTLRLKLEWKYVVLVRKGFSTPWPSQPSETSWAYDPLPIWTNQSLWTAWDQEPSFLSAGHPMPQPIYNGDIRDTLIRAAVDETFARAAWDRLCQQGCRLRLLDLRSLSSMEPPIRHWDNWHFLRTVTNLMEAHFLLQRSMADDSIVLSVNLEADKLEASSKYEMPDELKDHFRRLWPSKSVDGSWQDDWSSLPFPLTSIPTS